jgi:hypothetical protein
VIQWKIVLTDDNRIASLENATGLPQDSVESHLLIIGILENLKQKHLSKLNTQFEKTVRRGKEESDL